MKKSNPSAVMLSASLCNCCIFLKITAIKTVPFIMHEGNWQPRSDDMRLFLTVFFNPLLIHNVVLRWVWPNILSVKQAWRALACSLLLSCVTDVRWSRSHGGQLSGGPVEPTCVRVLAKQFWLQVEPLHDVLWHTQDWIHRLDLFISKQREACYSKESVKWVHLQRKRDQGGWKDRDRYPSTLY